MLLCGRMRASVAVPDFAPGAVEKMNLNKRTHLSLMESMRAPIGNPFLTAQNGFREPQNPPESHLEAIRNPRKPFRSSYLEASMAHQKPCCYTKKDFLLELIGVVCS